MNTLKDYSPYYTESPVCPKCGCACKRVFYNAEHRIVGCDQCTYSLDARYIKECKSADADDRRGIYNG